MRFIISRTSLWRMEGSPCKGALPIQFTRFIDCRCQTVKEAVQEQDWVRAGNPKQMKGFVRVFQKTKEQAWTIKVSSLSNLISLFKKHGQIIIKESPYKEIPLEIEIYDGFRE